MRQFVIRAISAVFFVASCFLVASMGNQWAANFLYAPRVITAPTVSEIPPAAPGWGARKPILDRNLFGARLAGGEEPVEEVVEEEVEETKLPLILLATIAAIETDLSRAAIHDQRTRVDEVVRPGDTLENHPNVTVDRIERGRVVLLNRGRREELTLADAEAVLATAPRIKGVQRRGAASLRPAPSKRPRAQSSAASRRGTKAERDTRNKRITEGIQELRELMASGRLSPQEFQREVEALGKKEFP